MHRPTTIFVDTVSMFAAVSMAVAAGTYHGNIKSKIFHDAYCRYFSCTNCVAVFETRAETIEAGFRACNICNP